MSESVLARGNHAPIALRVFRQRRNVARSATVQTVSEHKHKIQPEGLMICTALRAAMICQACGLDKQKQNICLQTNVLFLLACPTGFEPATSRVGVSRAIQLCHGQILDYYSISKRKIQPKFVKRKILLCAAFSSFGRSPFGASRFLSKNTTIILFFL